MAGATIRMTAKKQHTLQEIHKKLHIMKGAEQISKSAQTIHDVTIWTLVYEKYYFRTNSYASVTVVLTEYAQDQAACIIASGGGSGMVNSSYGANRNFAKSCVAALESCGFVVTESDLDAEGKHFVKYFFE